MNIETTARLRGRALDRFHLRHVLAGAAIATVLCLQPVAAAAEDAAAASLPKVALFTTGGTIQSKGEHRQKLMEYGAGRVTPQELLDDLPELELLAKLEVTEISNIGSGGMNTELLLELAQGLNAALAEPDVAGAVVTHGTGTLEETAYFLNLTVRSDKPVVVVGAMRPFTAVSRDGPFNLYNAVRVAATPEARGYGVMILLDDTINAARDTTKTNTYRVETFVARDLGPLGFADSDRVTFYRRPIYRHTHRSEFDVTNLTSLPRVDVNYVYQESDDAVIDSFIASGAKGIVLTSGSREAVKRGREQGVVFVRSDRKGAGRVMRSARVAESGAVTSDNLPPHKARILLRLALTRTEDPEEIQRMFDEY
jgi:L-asparaginase